MRSFRPILVAFALAIGLAPALAQFAPPPVLNPIPAPLPPPAPPPIINGPLGQSPPPGVYYPPALRTHSDRAVQCLHEGSSYGLRGRRLQTYTRSCANAN